MKCDVLGGRQRHSAVHGIFNICRRETPKPYLACQLSFPLQEGDFIYAKSIQSLSYRRDFAGERLTLFITFFSFTRLCICRTPARRETLLERLCRRETLARQLSFLLQERLCRRETHKFYLECKLSFPLQDLDFVVERLCRRETPKL